MAFTISLQNKIALVTGISNGIGRGIALELASAGARVFGCGLEEEESDEIKSLLQELNAHTVGCEYRHCNVADDNELNTWIKDLLNATDTQLDIVVSNAGRNTFTGAADTTSQQWDEAIDLNLRSHWRLLHYCRNALAASNAGVIIIVSSNHAFNTMPGCFPYNAAKAALVALVQSLALEWAPQIRTVGLAPGFIQTPGNDAWLNGHPDPVSKRNAVIASHPVQSIGTPAQLGGWCVFLASEYAAFASGTTYLIDGGRSASM